MKRTGFILGIAAALLVMIMLAGRSQMHGASAPQANAPTQIAVQIENFSFAPATVTVPAGTTVRWTNKDDSPHNVVGEDKSFKSKALDTDDSFSYTFAKPGTYSYFCGMHPKMTGKIVVQ